MDPTASAAMAAKESPTLTSLRKKYPNRDAEQLAGFAARIDELEKVQKEPVAWIVTSDSRLLVFRRPDQDEWEEATEQLRKAAPLAVINRQLALQTVLEPSQADMSLVFKRWPGLHARIGDALTILVGADEELAAKKD